MQRFDYLKGFDAAHCNLPHADAEHPNVAGCGETPEVDRLWRHPFDRKFPLRRLRINKFIQS